MKTIESRAWSPHPQPWPRWPPPTPALTRELKRLGFTDCCCRRCLAEACQEQDLDREAVIVELTAVPAAAEALAARLSRVHGENHPALIRVAEVLSEIRADPEPHLRKKHPCR